MEQIHFMAVFFGNQGRIHKVNNSDLTVRITSQMQEGKMKLFLYSSAMQ
jgi:hypothetical protein